MATEAQPATQAKRILVVEAEVKYKQHIIDIIMVNS